LTALLPAWIVGTASYFTSLQDAHDSAGNWSTIKAQVVDFLESLVVAKALTIIGGYNSDYTNNGNYTMVVGAVIVKSGAVTMENISIR